MQIVPDRHMYVGQSFRAGTYPARGRGAVVGILAFLIVVVSCRWSATAGEMTIEEWYDTLPCCGREDCTAIHDTEIRRVDRQTLEALIDGEWVKFPRTVVLPIGSMDGKTHLCFTTYVSNYVPTVYVRCVIFPGQS